MSHQASTVADEFDPQPQLRGQTLSLRPLVESDFESLYQAASDPMIWEQHPQSTRYRRDIFEEFFATAIAAKSALLVSDLHSGQVLGTSRYYERNTDENSVAIGYTFLIRARWGGAANRELKQLMLQHAFRWVDKVWFHVGKDNWRSRKAMEKIGGRLHCETKKMLNGREIDYAFYCIDREAGSRPS